MMSDQQTAEAIYTHSLKLEETAKGIRIHVHVYATDRQTALTEAFELYKGAKREAESRKIPIAPVEVK